MDGFKVYIRENYPSWTDDERHELYQRMPSPPNLAEKITWLRAEPDMQREYKDIIDQYNRILAKPREKQVDPTGAQSYTQDLTSAEMHQLEDRLDKMLMQRIKNEISASGYSLGLLSNRRDADQWFAFMQQAGIGRDLHDKIMYAARELSYLRGTGPYANKDDYDFGKTRRLPRKPAEVGPLVDQAVRLLQQGWTPERIALDMGLSVRGVLSLLAKAGREKRPIPKQREPFDLSIPKEIPDSLKPGLFSAQQRQKKIA